MMDFEDREDEQEGLPKWPFLASALFILCGALGFAYYHYHSSGQLEVWQLLVCILASGTASLLIFMPFLLERSLQLCLLTANRKDDELFRKVYFDLKEVRSDLEALSVKIDKVPTLVDKIVSDSIKETNISENLSQELKKLQDELSLKLSQIEDIATQEPVHGEPDPVILKTNQIVADLENKVNALASKSEEIVKLVKNLPTEFPETQRLLTETDSNPRNKQEKDIIPENEFPKEDPLDAPEEIEIKGVLHEDAFSKKVSDEKAFEEMNLISGEKPKEPEIMEKNDSEDIPDVEIIADEKELHPELDESSEITEDPLEPKKEEEEQSDLIPPLEDELENEKKEDEEPPPVPNELDLGLPDPEETIRKVDALLSGKPTKEAKQEKTEEKPSGTGITSVIANVMIGIGNKPYVRGEGPGLSWDEGVAMNFIEIGKWAWSPPRKNASLTIQIYRNDEDPDKGGKYEIKPGEKFEVTPEF